MKFLKRTWKQQPTSIENIMSSDNKSDKDFNYSNGRRSSLRASEILFLLPIASSLTLWRRSMWLQSPAYAANWICLWDSSWHTPTVPNSSQPLIYHCLQRSSDTHATNRLSAKGGCFTKAKVNCTRSKLEAFKIKLTLPNRKLSLANSP